MEVKIKGSTGMIDATIEMVDGVMVVSPKEEKFEPKDGDVCVHDGMIYIFKGVKLSSICSGKYAIIHHCYYDAETLQVKEDVGCGYIDCSQRFATEEEKKKLFDKLAEEGYEFDFEKKELVKIKWNPKAEETYYRPDFSHCRFMCYKGVLHYNTMIFIKDHIEKGWCFKTEGECQAFCDKLNQAIKGIKP